ncbi:MAG: anthranilate phosphoribosyltransferase [Myxococcaceae bacterium]|nr:anthranilate phosphoribosyltransferase [Myxococcaceae bacterium]
MMLQTLESLLRREDLSRDTMAQAMAVIAQGQVPPAQLAAFLTALRAKGETAEELVGAAEVVRRHAVAVKASTEALVDTCGTGGDAQGTFNISTAAAIVAAAAGARVAKHGNRSVSSKCGSADVLQALGLPVQLTAEQVGTCVREVGIGFLFAPGHHPAFGAVAAVRRELGFRTVFNLLGPMANPAGALRQVMGVFDVRWVSVVGEALAQLGTVHALVVHGDGLDEISLSGVTHVCEVRRGTTRRLSLTPEELGLSRSPVSALRGGDAGVNAGIISQVLAGERGAPRDAVVANAGAALYVGGVAESVGDGVQRAQAALDSGAARKKLAAWVELARSFTP